MRLPKPPGFIRAFFNRHPWVLDGFIAGGYLVPMGVVSVVLFVASLFGSGPFAGDPLRGSPFFALFLMYVGAAVGVALLFRRYVPMVTAAVCAAAILCSTPSAQQLDGVPMMFALYALAVYRSARSAWLWTAVAVTVGVVATILHDPTDLASIIGYGVLFAMLMTIATLVGITFGNRRRYIQALLDRAEQLARERDQRALLAAASERARIAREMHDIVAHSLTVIVALSDGAEASIDRAPESAREAVRQTGITARRALTDMRRSLGVLTDAVGETGADAAGTSSAAGASGAVGSGAAAALQPLAPQPGLDDLPELIESYRVAGLPVRFTATGEPPADPVLQLAVYRVVQESLTNALRYAVQASKVEVLLRFTGDRGGAEVEVADDGVDPQRGASSTGSGRGLIGMRERVAVHGGTVTAGPAGAPGTRGWRVRATMGGGAGSRPGAEQEGTG